MRFIDISFHPFSESRSVAWMLQRLHSSVAFMNHLPNDWENEMIVFADNYAQEQIGQNRFSIFPKSQSRGWGIWKLIRYLRRQKPDWVLIEGFIFPVQTLLLGLFLSRNTRIMVQHHGESPCKSRFKRWLQRMACARCGAYLFTAEANATDFVDKGVIKNTARIFEIPEASTNFIKQPKMASRKALEITGEPVFISVGRLNAGKDPLTVIEAFNQFSITHPRAVLYMIYQTEELLEPVKQRAGGQVVLVGSEAHEKLQTWFSAADFFISASHKEGSGYALIEAMACGCIPIVSDIPPFVKLTGKCGFLFEVGNSRQLVEKLHQAAASNRAPLSINVEEHFKTHLSFKCIADRLVEIVIVAKDKATRFV